MSLQNNANVLKILTTWAIEKSLLDLGKPTYDKVVEMLKNEYQCNLSDCFEHPEYLNATLKKLPDNSNVGIVVSITNELKEFLYSKEIMKFINSIVR